MCWISIFPISIKIYQLTWSLNFPNFIFHLKSQPTHFGPAGGQLMRKLYVKIYCIIVVFPLRSSISVLLVDIQIFLFTKILPDYFSFLFSLPAWYVMSSLFYFHSYDTQWTLYALMDTISFDHVKNNQLVSKSSRPAHPFQMWSAHLMSVISGYHSD